MGTLVGFVERAADLLAPIDGLHWKQLLAGSWMATDGTGIKVVVPQLPVAHNGYIELYRNRECAVFQYDADQGATTSAKLASFPGGGAGSVGQGGGEGRFHEAPGDVGALPVAHLFAADGHGSPLAEIQPRPLVLAMAHLGGPGPARAVGDQPWCLPCRALQVAIANE